MGKIVPVRAHQVVAHGNQLGQRQRCCKVKPRSRRGGEADAVVLHDLIWEEGQEVTDDVSPAGKTEAPATGQVNPPISVTIPGQG
jgi:hypothetical protein